MQRQCGDGKEEERGNVRGGGGGGDVTTPDLVKTLLVANDLHVIPVVMTLRLQLRQACLNWYIENE